MATFEQKQVPSVYGEDNNFEVLDSASCHQVRAKLETLFSGKSSLEEMPVVVKRTLFRHLENCHSCCRSFDVRVYFQPTARGRL